MNNWNEWSFSTKRSTTLGSHNLRLSCQEPFHPAYNRTSRRSLHTHTLTHSPGYPIWMPITCRHVAKLELAFTYFVDTYERAKWMGASKCNFLTLDVFRCRNVFASNEFNYWMYIIRGCGAFVAIMAWQQWMDGWTEKPSYMHVARICGILSHPKYIVIPSRHPSLCRAGLLSPAKILWKSRKTNSSINSSHLSVVTDCLHAMPYTCLDSLWWAAATMPFVARAAATHTTHAYIKQTNYDMQVNSTLPRNWTFSLRMRIGSSVQHLFAVFKSLCEMFSLTTQTNCMQ